MADDPSTDRPDRSPEWWQPPQDHAPAVLPITEVVASTPTVAIALVGAHIYPNGIELQLELRARRREEDDNEWHAVIDAFFARPGTPAGPRSELEATYAVSIDGGPELPTESLFGPHRTRRETPVGYSLMLTRPGGSGNQSSCTSSPGLWLWPLPVAQQLDLSIRWPAMQIPEARVSVDITRARELSALSRPLWN